MKTNSDPTQSPTNQNTSMHPRHVLQWYLAACIAYVGIMFVGGFEDIKELSLFIDQEPVYVLKYFLIALLQSPLYALFFPSIHFALFALFKSKRNKLTFKRIVKGWSIGVVVFVLLGTFTMVVGA